MRRGDVRPSRRSALGALASALVAWGASAQGDVFRVLPSAAPGGDGLSWSTAFADLDSAITAATSAPNSTIWIAEGTYLPTAEAIGGQPRSRRFALPAGVTVLGGFAGFERRADERDPSLHPVVLSGDLALNDGSGFVNRTDNAYHVVVVSAGQVAIDGVTIRGGAATSTLAADQLGGGVLLANAALTLTNVRVVDCLASGGGAGIASTSASLSLAGCEIDDNWAQPFGSDTNAGGGLRAVGGSVDAEDTSFSGNRAVFTNLTAGSRGGAVCLVGAVTASFEGCVIAGNISAQGAIAFADAPAGSANGVSISQCLFQGNSNVSGGVGAGYFQLDGNASISNSTFVDNVGGQSGGGLYVVRPVSFTLSDSMVFGNSCAGSGGGFRLIGGVAVVERVRVENNAALSGGGVAVEASSGGGPPTNHLFRDVVITENFVDVGGGGVRIYSPTAVPATILFDRCEIRKNAIGGVEAAGESQSATLATFRDTTVVANVGAGIAAAYLSASIERCTITGNTSKVAAGIYAINGTWTVRDSIIAGNLGGSGGTTLPGQIGFSPPANVSISHSLLPGPVTGVGNVVGNPTFINATGRDQTLGTDDDDLRGAPGALQVNAGDPTFLDLSAVDLTGAPRLQNCRLDIGAVESPHNEASPPDWNGDGITDACDILQGLDGDCDHDGLPDLGEIASGALDCDDDGVPDACSLTSVAFSSASPQLSPIGAGFPQTYTVVDPPLPIGNVTLSFAARADLNLANESITATLNGVSLGEILGTAGDCPTVPSTSSMVLTPAAFLAATGGGDASITMTASASVSPTQCSNGFISVTVSYTAAPLLDQNGNGVLDACEASGDFDGDGQVGAADLAQLLGVWGPCPGCSADLDDDGVVGPADLALLLGGWR